ncbi:MAG: hypothetical protein JW720_13205 [Sedimentisphaerales bacterium]|nr:hypothetical protein [Sedimentisphaerales bacterium]
MDEERARQIVAENPSLKWAVNMLELIDKLFELAGTMTDELAEHKCENADYYNSQLTKLFEQRERISKG